MLAGAPLGQARVHRHGDGLRRGAGDGGGLVPAGPGAAGAGPRPLPGPAAAGARAVRAPPPPLAAPLALRYATTDAALFWLIVVSA